MSLTDKLSMLMARPGGDNAQKDDVPWWMRYAGRGVGTVGGFIAIILGLLNCISIVLLDVGCLIAGIWQMLAGFIVIVCEAPCCCFFIDYVQTLSDKMETRPYWNKAACYVGLSVPPFFMCFISMSTWFGSGLIFATGIIYGMMALGKKGSRDDMAAMAAGGTTPPGAPLSASHDHNVTLMEDPDVWRPN
ncbi:calcium channel flower isoform X2 [Spodoptera litura]|uniref:Calcium channel flower n=3 Tax=Spodoptera TaxID=7106 RepID=A0A9J7E3B0_SPOLT|nr:calcium channel flower isoform X2 [Spodoptera litura]XP_035446522.1 calcium channel flower isoform X2 [Spodoptera frugiperda]